jgi:hypothetical protein
MGTSGERAQAILFARFTKKSRDISDRLSTIQSICQAGVAVPV